MINPAHSKTACATSLKKGVAVCGCTRIKDSVLREKFIEAYNKLVTQRPQGDNIAAPQSVVSGLKKKESELATLRMQRPITEADFRTEQRRIKAKQSCSVSAKDCATQIQAYSQRMQDPEARQEEQKSVAMRRGKSVAGRLRKAYR